ncbi:MAG: hypothetical protein JNJ83_10450 [Verrucomicrobiaceae bacterium]|nr:hypothetical protein [Verrucomicrobiaceae bacterium]
MKAVKKKPFFCHPRPKPSAVPVAWGCDPGDVRLVTCQKPSRTLADKRVRAPVAPPQTSL